MTLRRPGGGYGGYYRQRDTPDAYDPSSRRQTVEHWDMPCISWLYRNGYSCDFCTDLDLDRDASVLEGYRLLVGVGHDEYWTEPERQAVEAFIANGGNVAFFSGNTCWGKVAVIDSSDDTVLEGVGSPGWDPSNPLTSEASLTGVTYLNGGGWWGGHRTDVPYVLFRTNNWVFEGTGLRDGDKLAPRLALVGYEADGAQYAMQANVPVVNTAQGSPATFEILGIAQLLPIGRGDTDVAAGGGWDPGYGAPAGQVPRATMGLYAQPGRVFNAATTDWARVLAAGDTQIGRITRNVLDSLAQVKQIEDVVAVAAYYAKSDAYQHIVASTSGGAVREIFWAPQDPNRSGTGNGELTTFTPGTTVGLAGYYADGDEFQHVIVATTDGVVTEVFWQPGGPGVRQAQLTSFPAGSIVGVAGYYADGDQFQHVIVATTDGVVTEVFWQPGGPGVRQAQLTSFPAGSIVGVAGYYADGDQFQHVIVATTDGVVTEVFWQPGGPGVRQAQLTSFPAGSIVGVAGYYADGDQFQHVIVATTDGVVTEVFWQPGGPGVRQAQLTSFPAGSIVGVAGYYAGSTKYQHVIAATHRGNLFQTVF